MVQRIFTFTLVLTILGIGHSLPSNLHQSEEIKLWKIPQIDGSLRWMTEKEAEEEALLLKTQATAVRKMKKVRFFLYTPDNPIEPVEIDKNDPKSLDQSPFNYKFPTRFMIHGWNGGYNGSENHLIRTALLLQGSVRKYNFIAVDWSVYGESITYITSQQSVSKTGKIIAEFIDWMHDNAKLSFNTLAVYGHSLGAHVAGFTGKNVKRGKIHTIVGLDPAMPLFDYKNVNGRLADEDASYVETIHTNGGALGFYQPIGKASFYPNGGKNQPGCGIEMSCSHGRSVELFSEALALEEKNGFIATECKEFGDVQNGFSKCTVSEVGVRLGQESNSGHARGIYYLETNRKSLFGKHTKT